MAETNVDEQAVFESLRRMPGQPRIKKNIGVIRRHKELEQMCKLEIGQHQFDTKVHTAAMRRSKQQIEKKQDQLDKLQKRCVHNSKNIHRYLEETQKEHEKKERQLAGIRITPEEETAELIKELDKMAMPKRMKTDLMRQTFVTKYYDE